MRSITPKSLARKRLFMLPEIYLLMLMADQKVKGGIEEAPLYMFFSSNIPNYDGSDAP